LCTAERIFLTVFFRLQVNLVLHDVVSQDSIADMLVAHDGIL